MARVKSSEELEKLVATRYPRAVAHLAQQCGLERFSLVLGSGISKPFKLPNWSELVERIGRDPAVNGHRVLRSCSHEALPYQTQMLFEHFRRSLMPTRQSPGETERELDYHISYRWAEIVRKNLYRNSPTNLLLALKGHPYFLSLLKLVRKSQMTITYNFDDILEQAIAIDPNRGEDERKTSRGYETLTSLWGQLRSKVSNIYHAHGFFPRDSLDSPRDRFVFGEASYAEEMIGFARGDHAGMLSHLARHTCLFLGTSLGDEDLRGLLAQSAAASPGNFHYLIRHRNMRSKMTNEYMDAVSDTNFSVYNLITLYLDDAEISALARLLVLSEGELTARFAREKPPVFRFYVTGPMSVGKSTCVANLSNLQTLDEWVQPRRKDMGTNWQKLDASARAAVDSFIVHQFKLKNASLATSKAVGHYLIDRGPLDPVAFSPRSKWPAKTKRLHDEMCGSGGVETIVPGHLILLTADPNELAIRLTRSNRSSFRNPGGYDAQSLARMIEDLEGIYGKNGVTKIDTTGRNIAEVVKMIAYVIHGDGPYTICDFMARVQDLTGNTN